MYLTRHNVQYPRWQQYSDQSIAHPPATLLTSTLHANCTQFTALHIQMPAYVHIEMQNKLRRGSIILGCTM